jgi:hypothetical protein
MCLATCLDKELWKTIEYRKEQVRVLKEQQEKDKRILLSNHQRMRPAAKAKQLTRRLPEETSVLFTPETVFGWYRRLIAQKYDGSNNCKNPGRPKISQEIIDLVVRFKQENPRWSYTRIRDYLVYLGHKIGETTAQGRVRPIRGLCQGHLPELPPHQRCRPRGALQLHALLFQSLLSPELGTGRIDLDQGSAPLCQPDTTDLRSEHPRRHLDDAVRLIVR